ncbi:hypothetical protein TcCL_NonESM10927 [Trypanosoma cruzi]|nr:hypothetical protein TcCL_NonESM10927 [Trypanosoma cruzi]
MCFLRVLPAGMLGTSVATCARGACKEDAGTIAASACEASQTIGTPGRARRACALILWTDERRLCCRLRRRTSIRRSLVGKDLRCSRREELPAEAAAGRSLK